MWPGPYGQGGGSRKYLLASLDQSLARMGVDYVDIFYSHRFDPTPRSRRRWGALDTAVRSGRRSTPASPPTRRRTRQAVQILRELGTPLLIHQPSYSMLNRWIEEDLLDVLGETGTGCIAFSPLAQGMLTDKYLDGIPEGSRASRGTSLSPDLITDAALTHVRALNDMAAQRGQSLAQMALAWALRDRRVTSVLIGASSVDQLDDSLGALENLEFTDDELDAIDKHAVDAGINIWARSAERGSPTRTAPLQGPRPAAPRGRRRGPPRPRGGLSRVTVRRPVVEPDRQPEHREQRRGVQERGQPGDPARR
jgi:L-glyceraldehyde 3-phosphate reductase